MEKGRRLLSAALAAAALASIGAAVPAAASAELIDGVIATVDGSAITLRDLREFKEKRGAFMPAEQRNDYRSLLDTLIEDRLLALEFKKNQVTASDSDIEIYIDNVLEQTNSSREEVKRALEESGLTWDDYFDRMREEVQRLALVNLLIRSRINVSPEEVERAWLADPEYMEPPKVEIAHIYLPFPEGASEADLESLRVQADDIYARVRKGGFEAAAREHSAGPTAAEGGYLGLFTRGSMAPYFEKAVAELSAGGVAPPIEASDGIHIVKLLRTLPSKRIPLEKVRDELRNRLYDQRLDERFRRWASEDLRKAHHVTINLEDLALIAGS